MELGLDHMTVIGNELALRWTDQNRKFFSARIFENALPVRTLRR